MGFFKSIGLGGATQRDFLSPKGQAAIALGQPGYLYDQSKERQVDKANAAAAANEAAIVGAKHDAQDAANASIIDARKRKRAQSLITSGTPLGGSQTALGSALPAAQPLGTTALAYGGY